MRDGWGAVVAADAPAVVVEGESSGDVPVVDGMPVVRGKYWYKALPSRPGVAEADVVMADGGDAEGDGMMCTIDV